MIEENGNVAPKTKSDNPSIRHKNRVVETPHQLDKANSARASIRSVGAESKKERAEVKVVTHASLEVHMVEDDSLEVHMVEDNSSTPLTVSRV